MDIIIIRIDLAYWSQKTMTVQGSQLLNIAKNVLTQLGILGSFDVKITLAEQQLDEWLVNFSYKTASDWYDRHGCFKVKIESAEITGMWLDKTWQ